MDMSKSYRMVCLSWVILFSIPSQNSIIDHTPLLVYNKLFVFYVIGAVYKRLSKLLLVWSVCLGLSFLRSIPKQHY